MLVTSAGDRYEQMLIRCGAALQANAEEAVREMLAEFSREQGLGEVGTVHAEDHMDDGTLLRLAVHPAHGIFCLLLPPHHTLSQS